MTDDNKEQLDAVQATDPVEDEQNVPVEGEFDDDLSMVELVPQPEVGGDALHNAEAADVAPMFEAEAAQGEQADVAPQVREDNDRDAAKTDKAQTSKRVQQNKEGSGIALPLSIEQGASEAFAGVGTQTGIPLPVRQEKHDKEDKEDKEVEEVEEVVKASDSEDEGVVHFPTRQYTVASQDDDEDNEEAVASEEVVEQQSEVRSEFSNTVNRQEDMHFVETDIDEDRENIWSARQLGAAITANELFAFEPLANVERA